MRTILINPPIHLPEDFAHYPMFSTLGLLSNAAWLREKGRTVEVVDAFTVSRHLRLRDDGGGFRHLGLEVDELAEVVAERVAVDEPAALVITVTMFSDLNRVDETLVPQVAAALRARLPHASIGLACLYINGMNYFPFDTDAMLERIEAVDWILVGEGEPTLPELLDRVERGDSLAGLPRVARRLDDGSPVFDASAPEPLRDIDDIPLPAFDLLDMERYFSVQAEAIQSELVHEYHLVERQLPLMTSRGCPYRCNFCTNQVLGLPWRAHSVPYVSRAMRELRERYGVDRFLFLDDNINVNAERFRELVRELAEVRVPWDAVNGYRADHLDREMVQAIKAAGNTKITVSAESGDPDLLNDVINKRMSLPKVVKLAKLCEEEEVPLQVHFIVGVPGETKAQINKTLEFSTVLFEKHGAWPLLQHAIPFPGTALFRTCEEEGYFVAPPHEVPGALLEVRSIIRTPEFTPEEVFRMKRNAQHLHASIQALPHVAVETRCSNRCLSCHCDPSGEGAAPPSREQITAALEHAWFLGGREVFLGGGEPTLREDLPEIVAEARRMGFSRVALLTNAHGLADAGYASRLFAERVDRLVVELHGPDAALHDRLARRRGSFSGTVTGVRRAVAKEGIDLEINVAVTRDNLSSLPKTVRRARQLGARAVHLQIPPPDSQAATEGRIPFWEEARPWLDRALASAPEGTVHIQGAPLCLMPEHAGAIKPLPPWELRRTRNFRARHRQCEGCVGFVLCAGFFRSEHEPLYRMMDAAGDSPAPPAEEPSSDAAE